MQLFEFLEGGLPGPLDLLIQLSALGAVAGLALTAAAGKHSAAIAAAIGAPPRSLAARLALLLGAVGASGAIAYAAAAAGNETDVTGLPGFWPMLFGAGVGLVVVVALIRRRPSPAEALVGIAGGALGPLGLAAAIAYWDWASAGTVIFGAAAGALVACAWLVLRVPALGLARRIGRPPRAERAGVVAVASTWAGFGTAAAWAWVAADGPRIAGWLSALVVAVALAAVPAAIRFATRPVVRREGVEVGGYRTTILQVSGRRRRPPVVFFHGYGGDAETWRPVMELLAVLSRRRLLAISVPGIALDLIRREPSGADPVVGILDDGPTLPQLEQFGRATLERFFPGESVFAVGHSVGGLIVLGLARNVSGRATSPLCGFQVVGTMGLDRSRPLRVVGRGPVAAVIVAALRGAPGAIAAWLAGWMYRALNPAATSHGVVRVRELARERTEGHPVLAVGVRIISELAGTFDLASIGRIPGHFIWGENDWLSPESNAAVVRRARPDFTVDVLEGLGHSPNVTEPLRFAHMLLGSPAFRRARSSPGHRARAA